MPDFALEAKHTKALVMHEEATAGREDAVAAFFEALTDLVKACMPSVRQAVDDAAKARKKS